MICIPLEEKWTQIVNFLTLDLYRQLFDQDHEHYNSHVEN